MTLTAAIDEHVLRQYRELLDSEDAAFDELEHAYEDGDRHLFDQDIDRWVLAARQRESFLRKIGLVLDGEPSADGVFAEFSSAG